MRKEAWGGPFKKTLNNLQLSAKINTLQSIHNKTALQHE